MRECFGEIRVLPASDYRRERWRNGAGWTREIVRLWLDQEGCWAIADVDDDEWHVRLSIADIECDCTFSAFPGITRELVLLQGDGIALELADGRSVCVEPRYGRIRFAGDIAPACRLLGGPTRDFNLMWRPSAVQTQLLVRPLVGSLLFALEPGTCWALHLLSGQARFANRPGAPTLAAGDSALLMPAGRDRTRVVLDGSGEALLVQLRAV